MNLPLDELAALLGFKDIEIHVLRKQLAEAQKRIAELEAKAA